MKIKGIFMCTLIVLILTSCYPHSIPKDSSNPSGSESDISIDTIKQTATPTTPATITAITVDAETSSDISEDNGGESSTSDITKVSDKESNTNDSQEVNGEESITNDNTGELEYIEIKPTYDKEKGLIYLNKKDGYIIDLPESWDGYIIIEEYVDYDSIRFMYVASNGESDTLFFAYLITKEEYETELSSPSGGSFAINEQKGGYLEYSCNIENSFSKEEDRDRFQSMMMEVFDLQNMVTFIDK